MTRDDMGDGEPHGADGSGGEAEGEIDRASAAPGEVVRGGSTQSDVPARGRAPLLGRERERAALVRALQRVEAERQARVVSLIGPRGVGKSRLARDFLEEQRARGSAVASRIIAATARNEGAAYGVFGRLLRARFGVVNGMDEGAARAQIRAQAAEVMGDRKVGDVLYFLGQLVGLPFEESPLTRAVRDDLAEAALIRRAVLKAFLEADAERGPFCLVLEDLHEAHDDSLALLRYLIDALEGPVLVLCAARPELVARREEWSKVGEGRHEVLEIGPLAEADAAAVMEALLAPAGEPPRALVDAACAFAAGNPQLLEQMVRTYLDRGVLVDAGEAEASAPSAPSASGARRWRVDLERLSAARLPMTVEDVVNVRLAALGPAERQILEQAAAIGSVFWSGALVVLGRAGSKVPDLWADADGGDVAALQRALDALVTREYLAKLPGSRFPGSDEYAFRHAKEREALLSRTSPAARRRYHRAIADWLEQQGAARTRTEEHLAMLAAHREQVGDPIGAGLALIEAGDAARGRYANVRAAEHYSAGLALLGEAHVARRIDALHHYGDVLQLAGRVEEALAAFREMLSLAYRLDNRRKGGAAHNRIGRLHREVGALEEAGQHLGTALRLFEAAGDERGVASTIDDIGKLRWMKGEYRDALIWLRDALARRERLGDRRSIALSLHNVGLALQDSGEFKQARMTFERSLAIRREISDLLGVVSSLNSLGAIAQDQRDVQRALELFREALEVARQVGDRNRLALLLTNIGEACYRSGDPDEGVRVLQQAEALCDELGDKRLLAEVLRGLGKAHLLRGDLIKAREAISRAVDVFTSVRSKVQLGVALRTLGEIAAAGGWGSTHTKSARAYFDRSVAILGETGNEVELARTLTVYARYLITEPAFVSNRAARRDASLMNQRADAIFARLSGSVLIDDEPTAPGTRVPVSAVRARPQPASSRDAEPRSGERGIDVGDEEPGAGER